MAMASTFGISALHAGALSAAGPGQLDGEVALVRGLQSLQGQVLAGASWTACRLPTGLGAERRLVSPPSCKFHRTTFAKKTRKGSQPAGFGIRKTDGRMAERLKEVDREDASAAAEESTKRAQSQAEASTSAPSSPSPSPPSSPPYSPPLPPVSSRPPSTPPPNQAPPPVAAVTAADEAAPTEDAAVLQPPPPPPPLTRLPKERERPPGITVEDLMHMIKDAEKNILLLNRVRTRAVEDLDQAKTENEVLKGQIEVLKARLLESEAKVKLAVQIKAKNQLLESQVEMLQSRVNEMDMEMKGLFSLGQENTVLQEQISRLQALVQESEARAAQLAPSQRENEALREKTQRLEAQFSEMSAKEKLTSAERSANEKLREQIRELEGKLRQAEGAQEQAAKAEAESQELKDEVQKLKGTLFKAKISARLAVGGETGTSSRVQAEILQEQVELLRASLAEATAEREVFQESEAENALLRSQVDMLEKRLLESDAEIRSQLEMYQREVEAFEDRISDDGNGIMQVPIGEMPWDFWSNLLLRIDALMIGKYMTTDQGLDLRLMAWQRDARIRDVYAALQDEKLFSDEDVASGLKELIKVEKRPGLHIVHIAAEMAPVAKVGGLADVVTGLGRALQKKGHLVEFILPKYDNMDYTRIKDLKVMEQDFFSYFDGEMFKNKIWRGIVEGLPVYFLEPHHPGRFFWRGQFYGCEDDFRRFTYFCRAALEFLYKTKKKPDIIHSHDWQTAAIAPLYWDVYNKLGMDSAQVAFTCHNFEYQGTAPPGALTACGLNPDRFFNQERMQDNFMLDRINLLKGGIVFSTIVTTVSPTYAQEVRGPEGGKGLHPTLARHSRKFFGILNGIDDDAWNPATDPLLEYQYSAEDPTGKAANKAALRARLGLSARGQDADKPLVGCVTRLVPQKGVHLIRHAIFRTLERGGQFILLGSSPVPSIQQDFENIARQFGNHPHIRLVLKYDESLSHSIYAASDMFIIPSIFEPCGLTQLIAMRYGSVPIARKTGGLNDSVFDVDDESIPDDLKNGFTFSAIDEQGMNYALDRALDAYYDSRAWWQTLVAKVMAMDFSWEKPSEQFIELYRNTLAKAAPR